MDKDKFHLEKFEAYGIGYVEDCRNVILILANRIREIEPERKQLIAISIAAKNLSKHIDIIYGEDNPIHISPTTHLNTKLKEALNVLE